MQFFEFECQTVKIVFVKSTAARLWIFGQQWRSEKILRSVAYLTRKIDKRMWWIDGNRRTTESLRLETFLVTAQLLMRSRASYARLCIHNNYFAGLQHFGHSRIFQNVRHLQVQWKFQGWMSRPSFKQQGRNTYFISRTKCNFSANSLVSVF